MQSEIPEDVMNAAKATISNGFIGVESVARAIMAERERCESALSAAEPAAAMTTDYLGCEYVSSDVANIEKIASAGTKGTTPVRYLYDKPQQSAPSVAVKALEWETDTLTHTKDDGAEFPSSHYWTAKHHVPGLLLGWEISRFVDERFPKVTRSFVLRIGKNEKEFATLDEAKAAAQADYEARIRSALSAQVQDVAGWQQRVEAAHHALFHDDPTDVEERRARFWEEAGETVQAFGMTEEDAIELVRYTWSRAKGEPAKEIGAAMLTLTSLCVAAGYNLSECAEADLEKLQRPETIARIRAKRSTRHGRGPLPGFDPAAPAKQEG